MKESVLYQKGINADPYEDENLFENEQLEGVKMEENIKSKLDEVTEKLEQGIKSVFESGKFEAYLKTMDKMYNYSTRNIILIHSQYPEASFVAGYRKWQNDLGHQVQKGEKSIQILAPNLYSLTGDKAINDIENRINNSGQSVAWLGRYYITKNYDQTYNIKIINGSNIESNISKEKLKDFVQRNIYKKIILGFKVENVFDLGQTKPLLVKDKEGNEVIHPKAKDLRFSLVDKINDADLDTVKRLYEAVARTSKASINIEKVPGRANGYFSPVEEKIVVDEGLTPTHALKTLIHENVHSNLHSIGKNEVEDKDKNTIETEAEAVAYTVCNHYGVDTSNYSFAYLASWSSGKELKELNQSLETIKKEATSMIEQIDNELKNMKDKSIEEIQEESKFIKHKLFEVNMKNENLINSEVIEQDYNKISVETEKLIQENNKSTVIKDNLNSNTILTKIEIYQVKDEFTREVGFESLDTLINTLKREVNINNYDKVAQFVLPNVEDINMLPDKLYMIGNTSDAIQNYAINGHNVRSISVSDVIVIDDKPYYVDDIGFKVISDFKDKKENSLEFIKKYNESPIETIIKTDPSISELQAKIISSIDQEILRLPSEKMTVKEFLEAGKRQAQDIENASKYVSVQVVWSENSKFNELKGKALSFKEANKLFAIEEAVIKRAKEEGIYPGGYEKTKLQIFIKGNNQKEQLYVYNTRVDIGDGYQQDLKDYMMKSLRESKENCEMAIIKGENLWGDKISKEEVEVKKAKLNIYPLIEEKVDKGSRERVDLLKKNKGNENKER